MTLASCQAVTDLNSVNAIIAVKPNLGLLILVSGPVSLKG